MNVVVGWYTNLHAHANGGHGSNHIWICEYATVSFCVACIIIIIGPSEVHVTSGAT